MQKTVATDVKFVHVVSNPYDNVAATLKRYLVHVRNPTLSAIVEDYFALLALVTFTLSGAARKRRLWSTSRF